MASCRDIEPFFTAFVDDEANAADRAAVSEHLVECGVCRRRASDERAARRILRERANALRVEAPAALRARCRPAPQRTRLFGFVGLRSMPAWATAMVVVGVFAAVFYAASRGSTAFAAGLALDHLKCFTLFETSSGPPDPIAIADRMKATYGWSVAVPAAAPALALHLVGGRRCFSTDGRVAHILYRHAGRPLSLFIVPGTARAAQELAVLGHEAIIWSHRGRTFIVMAREPKSQVAPVVEYMKAVVD